MKQKLTILEIDCAIRFCELSSKHLTEMKLSETKRWNAKKLKMTAQEFEKEMNNYDDEILDWAGWRIDLLADMEKIMTIHKQNYRDSFNKK